jgi:hypothetical protein
MNALFYVIPLAISAHPFPLSLHPAIKNRPGAGHSDASVAFRLGLIYKQHDSKKSM